MPQHSHMSTQALLDELAARERRVLEQLHELSGIDQSPISPRQAYASVQATPYTPQHVFAAAKHAAAEEGAEEEEDDATYAAPSRGTFGNLEHDLARLQHLLRHSPLRDGESRPPIGEGRSNQPDLATPTMQRYTTQRGRGETREVEEEEEERGYETAREKRTRVSPAAPASGSPVAPEVKRDRRETLSYAPPPPFRMLRRGSSNDGDGSDDVAVAVDASPRRSDVLDMSEEEGGVDGDGARCAWRTDVVRSPRGHTVPRFTATMFAAHVADGRDAPGVRSYSEALRGSSADLVGQWRRSPVRWVTAAAESSTGQRGTALNEEASGGIPCTSAAKAWASHHPPTDQHEEELARTQPVGRIAAASTAATPPPLHFSLDEASVLEMVPPGPSAGASPPPRVPLTPSPVPRAAPTATAIATPAAGEMDFALLPTGAAPRAACTPPPSNKVYGMLGEPISASAAGVGHPRRAASVLPRGVLHTTSWRGLRAFFARQSRVPLLLTPDVASAEESAAHTVRR